MRKISFSKNSILIKIFLYMLIVLFLQWILLTVSIYSMGLFERMDNETLRTFQQKAEYRNSYLANMFTKSWMDIDSAHAEIIHETQSFVDKYDLTYASLNDPDESGSINTHTLKILNAAKKHLISTMRMNKTTGAFMALSVGNDDHKFGLYIRDDDPNSNSNDNSDLKYLIAPLKMTEDNNLSLSAKYQSIFTKKELENCFYTQTLAIDEENFSYNQGYWSDPFEICGTEPVISYTLPLINGKGETFGIMGIDISLNYLQTLLPYHEIDTSNEAIYNLCISRNDTLTLITQTSVDKEIIRKNNVTDYATLDKNLYKIMMNDKSTLIGCVSETKVYDTNSINANTYFILSSYVPESVLFRASHSIDIILMVILIVTFVVALAFILIASYRFSKPIVELTNQVRNSSTSNFTELKKVNIREIDDLTDAIDNLNHEVYNNLNKFNQLIELLQIPIGVFEYDMSTNRIFASNQYFDILEIDRPETLTTDLMISRNDNLKIELVDFDEPREESVYKLLYVQGDKWIRVKEKKIDNKVISVINDVTHDYLEKQTIEHERDHDVLTNIYNRRAFMNRYEQLIKEKKHLPYSAFLLMDLDELKTLNDMYGHDIGDLYLRTTANVMRGFTSKNFLVGRMSGDEFYAFIYGFNKPEDIHSIVSNLKKSLNETEITLPDHKQFRIHLSGGVSLYPTDTKNSKQLIKYADFAMFTAKKNLKGEFLYFNSNTYGKNSYLVNKKQALRELIENNMVKYYMQPIVNVNDGRIFSYEALMRTTHPTLKDPKEILTLATQQASLEKIEKLTLFNAIDKYAKNKDKIGDKKLFVNTLPNNTMRREDIMAFEKEYKNYLHNIVFEFTENEQIDEIQQALKKYYIKRWNCQMAIDDYGSGYNSEYMLLKLKPDYLKLDMSLIRDIDSDSNKYSLVEHTVAFAKSINIIVIAEGVETAEELSTLVKLNVDMVQGFFLAKPSFDIITDDEINPQAIEILRK